MRKFGAGFIVGFILAVALIWAANYAISHSGDENKNRNIELNGARQAEVFHA